MNKQQLIIAASLVGCALVLAVPSAFAHPLQTIGAPALLLLVLLAALAPALKRSRQ